MIWGKTVHHILSSLDQAFCHWMCEQELARFFHYLLHLLKTLSFFQSGTPRALLLQRCHPSPRYVYGPGPPLPQGPDPGDVQPVQTVVHSTCRYSGPAADILHHLQIFCTTCRYPATIADILHHLLKASITCISTYSLSLWRVVWGSKLMHLDLIHGLFIT